jgi:hypothetical protein
MNFGIKGKYSIVLMSSATNAPYSDKMLDDGIIEYEGHDIDARELRTLINEGVIPFTSEKKTVDQPLASYRTGVLTENGKFFSAATRYKKSNESPAVIQVYRKLKPSIWVNEGRYGLIDAALQNDGQRKVFKFYLKPITDGDHGADHIDLEHDRNIPGDIKREVYQRDQGKCVKCGSDNNLHFDHILPFSKGGTSKKESNIQLLCARHNLQKSNNIE